VAPLARVQEACTTVNGVTALDKRYVRVCCDLAQL
jgi:hypothetical protein